MFANNATPAATLDVAVLAVDGADATTSFYALFAVENEFGDRACKQLTKATPAATAAPQRLRLGGTHAAQLHVDVYAAAAGSNGAAAWDDAHVGEARVWLSQLPADGSAATVTVPLAASSTAATLTLSLALTHDASLTLPARTTAVAVSRLRAFDRTASADDFAATCDAASTGSSLEAPGSPLVVTRAAVADAAAQRIVELERELAALRQHVAPRA